MDAIISSALETICVQGQAGLSLASLWTELSNLNNNSLTPSFKASIYSNLLRIPSLQFLSPQNDPFDPNDAAIQLLEDAEKLGVKIVASLQLRDNFVGLYDTPAANANLSVPQRRTLERLAIARSNGLTQNQLAKEFGIEGKNLFYIVRNLECNGLIVRQPAVVRTREAGSEGEPKNSSCVTTNLMFLYRYAKHLGSQQRFEISKDGPIVDSFGNGNVVGKDSLSGESVKEDVHVKDFLPAMKDICDKLEEANGKVLVVSDIKQGLGYFGPSKHKAWRAICRRLTDAGIVMEFDAKVNDKVERCLRLLKKFSSKSFEPNNLGCGDNFNKEEPVKFGRRFPKNDQLVELPIEHQIYDMVDAKGSNGLTVMEVCDRLGIDKKKNYARLRSMFSRFGMPLKPENHKRTLAYRVWTPGNSKSKSFNAFHSKFKKNSSEDKVSCSDFNHIDDASHGPYQTYLEYNHSISKSDLANCGEEEDTETNTEISPGSFGDDKTKHRLPCSEQELVHDPSDTTPGKELVLVNSDIETNVSPSGTKHPALRKAHTNSSPSLTPNSLRREQWILERLQDEKFILRVELHRWLMNLEVKGPTIDRKTIERILANLQRQGLCKCIDISVPAVTNCGRTRTTRVVLHPSVQSLTPDLLGEIHDRLRSFEIQIRGGGSSKMKKNEFVPVLDGVQRTQCRINSDDKTVKYEAMRANGFVMAKMVRAKLLHCYLWSFLSKQPGWDDTLSSRKYVTDLKLSCNSSNLFSLEVAIKNIPIELFLQVAGSSLKFDDLIEKCKRGLSLSDLSVEEYRSLMDTRATGRLSLIIDILRRLKLIRLVNNGHSDDGIKYLHASLSHSMELKPYIEEPPSIAATSNAMLLDLRPRIRHDFFLSSKEAVNEYWQTLEYCYAAADPRASRLAFPGSAVHEVFHYRSWASVRVMTADQRADEIEEPPSVSSNSAVTEQSRNRGTLDLKKLKEREERERKEEVNRKIASKKALSVILRREATKAVIDKKWGKISSKRLLPRTVLEALHDRITALRWESALKVFELLREQLWYRPNSGVYIKLIVMLGKCKQPEKAHELFQAMVDEGCAVNHQSYTALLSAYGRSARFDKAFFLLEQMKSTPDCHPDVNTYSILIKSCLQVAAFDEVQALLSDMKTQGIKPNTITYNTLVDAYGKAKMFAEMESTLVKMLGEECEPDVWTMNSTLRAFGNSGQIETMEKCYEKFQRAGIDPSINTFNILLDSYGKAAEYEKMSAVMEYMQKYHYSWTIVTYNIVIDAFGRAGDLKQMEYLFRLMRSERIKPSCVTFCSLVRAYGKASKPEKIGGVLRFIENSDVTLDTVFFNCLVDAYGRLGLLAEMKGVLEMMELRGCKPDKITYRTMVKAYSMNGMISHAKETQHLIKSAEQTRMGMNKPDF